jgi:hypothetical protein
MFPKELLYMTLSYIADSEEDFLNFLSITGIPYYRAIKICARSILNFEHRKSSVAESRMFFWLLWDEISNTRRWFQCFICGYIDLGFWFDQYGKHHALELPPGSVPEIDGWPCKNFKGKESLAKELGVYEDPDGSAVWPRYRGSNTLNRVLREVHMHGERKIYLRIGDKHFNRAYDLGCRRDYLRQSYYACSDNPNLDQIIGELHNTMTEKDTIKRDREIVRLYRRLNRPLGSECSVRDCVCHLMPEEIRFCRNMREKKQKTRPIIPEDWRDLRSVYMAGIRVL